jgi:hypothetical protein
MLTGFVRCFATIMNPIDGVGMKNAAAETIYPESGYRE